jgi:hypothetical protein
MWRVGQPVMRRIGDIKDLRRESSPLRARLHPLPATSGAVPTALGNGRRSSAPLSVTVAELRGQGRWGDDLRMSFMSSIL